MPDFEINSEEVGSGVCMIRVEGFLDAHTFEEMENTINNLFNQNQFKIIVDLSGVDYISSAGAGVFIGAIGTAQENQGNIVLMKPTENVMEVFDLLGLSQLFSFAEDVPSAVNLF
ncbi:MAG: STAS domain-containing protein [Planctomycetota bacterium]|jgi:anti-sigma B factor antagonist